MQISAEKQLIIEGIKNCEEEWIIKAVKKLLEADQKFSALHYSIIEERLEEYGQDSEEGISSEAFKNELSDEGKKVSLKELKGKKVILYFYPKDDTSGCTAEACSFRDNIKLIEKKNAVVIGVSKDNTVSHQKFKKKYSLPFTLLSDENLDMLKDYEVWKEKSMYGKKYMGIERTTFILDEKGKIQDIFNKVKVQGHTEELLKKI